MNRSVMFILVTETGETLAQIESYQGYIPREKEGISIEGKTYRVITILFSFDHNIVTLVVRSFL